MLLLAYTLAIASIITVVKGIAENNITRALIGFGVILLAQAYYSSYTNSFLHYADATLAFDKHGNKYELTEMALTNTARNIHLVMDTYTTICGNELTVLRNGNEFYWPQ